MGRSDLTDRRLFRRKSRLETAPAISWERLLVAMVGGATRRRVVGLVFGEKQGQGAGGHAGEGVVGEAGQLFHQHVWGFQVGSDHDVGANGDLGVDNSRVRGGFGSRVVAGQRVVEDAAEADVRKRPLRPTKRRAGPACGAVRIIARIEDPEVVQKTITYP